MGVSCKLYINARHDVGHVRQVIVAIGAVITNVEFREDHAFIYFKYKGEEREMLVSRNSDFGPECTGLNFNQWGHATEIMTKIANILGGFLIPSDCDDKAIAFQEPHNGLSRFILADRVAKATGYDRSPVKFNPDTMQDELAKKP